MSTEAQTTMEQNVAYEITSFNNQQNVYDIVDQKERKKIDQPTQPAKKFQGRFNYSCIVSTLTLILALLATILAVVAVINYSSTQSTANGGQSTTDMTTDPPTMAVTSPAACGGPGWRRVAFLNMTDPSQNCPQGLDFTGYSIRSCGRLITDRETCSSVTFLAGGVQYSQVCGRVTAYHWGYNYAFYGYHRRSQNIDGYYVDGLSLTHGFPRTHIWTFASGLFNGSSGDSHPDFRCPCDSGNRYGSPPFVGNDYFCDSAATNTTWENIFGLRSDNALWDGQSSLNTCYNKNNPPWFRKTLSTQTSDNIELRICFTDPLSISNIGIKHLEIYIAA